MLLEASLINAKCGEFDESCLTPTAALSPREIQNLRKREGLSQSVLPRHLNVAVKFVGEWGRGHRQKAQTPSHDW